MNNPEWYTAKTIYKHHCVEDGVSKTVFEERVVLFQVTSFEEAMAKAEAEAAEYCRVLTNTEYCAEYLGFVDVFHIGSEPVGHGTEVYSLMRDSELSDKGYLDRFHDDGNERRQMVE